MKFKYTDYHLHSRWSHDIKENGPLFEDYIKIAEEQRINLCFLDHYELYSIDNYKDYPFYDGTKYGKIEQYLDEIDTVKENFGNVLSGLEIDYYIGYETRLREFMDEYKNQFDFLAGSIHETDYGAPVTTRELLIKLLEKKSVKKIVDDYFYILENMIKSGIFKNVCHPDTVFRYINSNDIVPPDDCDISDERILNIGRLCIEKGIKIEYNLSGIRFPINQTFPSIEIITQLKHEGAQIFVGSDSHSLDYFKSRIPKIKEAYQYLDTIRM